MMINIYLFTKLRSFKQKVACTALRYFTLLTKSCLVFSSTKDKRSRDNVSIDDYK